MFFLAVLDFLFTFALVKNNYKHSIHMKRIIVFLFVLLLAVIHVHLSINTQDNGLNPLTIFCMLNSSTLWSSERNAMIFGGIIIQSLVTMCIACYFMKWKKYPIWIADIILCVFIGFMLKDTYFMIFKSMEGLNTFYQRLYDTELPDLCSNAFLFSTIQIILLTVYPLGQYLSNKIRNFDTEKKHQSK
jgi:hypothetical protein